MEGLMLAQHFFWTAIEGAVLIVLLAGLARAFPDLSASLIQLLGVVGSLALVFFPHGFALFFGRGQDAVLSLFWFDAEFPQARLFALDAIAVGFGVAFGSIGYMILEARARLTGHSR